MAAPVEGPRSPRQEPFYYENGRYYTTFRRGKYIFPCDEEEQERLDIFHKMFYVARHDRLFTSHLYLGHREPPRILDLGTGTSIWACDVAECRDPALASLKREGQSAVDVMGIDLSTLQPATIPPNLSFLMMDVESPWHGLGQESWDLIHCRALFGAIRSWPALYVKILHHLKPQIGCFEQVEIDWTPRCDDGTLPPNSHLRVWGNEVLSAMEEYGCPMRVDAVATKGALHDAGFVNINEEIVRIPVNAWPNEPLQQEIGRWFNLGMTQGRGLTALSMAPLTRIKGWSPQDVAAMIEHVSGELCNRHYHAYFLMYSWTAKRP